ncbi:MAG: HTH domain-containing protein [Desulfosporosinus sp.]
MRTRVILNGRFEVTDVGDVYKIKNGVKTTATISIHVIHGRKYGQFAYYENGKQRHIYVHKAIAEAFIPNPNNYPMVRFDDGDSLNVNADNLKWCTPRQRVAIDRDAGRLHSLNKDGKECLFCGEKTCSKSSICTNCRERNERANSQKLKRANKLNGIGNMLKGVNKDLLTPRQLEVVEKRLTGLTYQQIADETGVSRQSIWEAIKDSLIKSNVVSVYGR